MLHGAQLALAEGEPAVALLEVLQRDVPVLVAGLLHQVLHDGLADEGLLPVVVADIANRPNVLRHLHVADRCVGHGDGPALRTDDAQQGL